MFAVGLTTAAVAFVAHALVPAMPWPAAIALGAIVAPPDAVAATAVLRPLHPPHRLLTILEGESLLNDASALLIYRLAVGAAAAGSFSAAEVAPAFLLAVAGSLVVGPALGWLLLRSMNRVQHVPTVIILQFITTFVVWIVAEHLAVVGGVDDRVFRDLRRSIRAAANAGTPADSRLCRVGDGGLRVNILAFIFIGLQIRPILASLEPGEAGRYLAVAGAVLLTVIVVRFAWHMPFNAVVRWRDRTVGFHPPRPMLRATVGSGLLISWAGMRGIVSLATALALPLAVPVSRPDRADRVLRGPRHAGDPGTDAEALAARCSTCMTMTRWAAKCARLARARWRPSTRASQTTSRRSRSTVRKQFKVQLTTANGPGGRRSRAAHGRNTASSIAEALDAARQAVIAMRAERRDRRRRVPPDRGAAGLDGNGRRPPGGEFGMSTIPSGSELARPFLPAKDFDLSKRFYEALGFEKVLDSEVAIFNAGSGGFILQRYYQKEWAENFMMQLMVDDLDAWWLHISGLDLPGRFGVQPPKAPMMQPWGLRISYVVDPSGVLWHVAQRRTGAAQD